MNKEFGVYTDHLGNVVGVVSPSVGDLVELKSGGLPLTVLDACDGCGDVNVAYTDSDGDIDILTLPAAALKPFADEGVPEGATVH